MKTQQQQQQQQQQEQQEEQKKKPSMQEPKQPPTMIKQPTLAYHCPSEKPLNNYYPAQSFIMWRSFFLILPQTSPNNSFLTNGITSLLNIKPPAYSPSFSASLPSTRQAPPSLMAARQSARTFS
jgi:hypothetical protein